MSSSIFSGAILYVLGSISTNMGVAPTETMVSTVETKVKGVVITSCPFLTPQARRAMCNASVPEARP
ncbi:MAG: hypothetical protein COW04_09820, partial [Deltaproteobacteria bacterium CG12_big_fil_rev_8_21_14_0_65_43_10]